MSIVLKKGFSIGTMEHDVIVTHSSIQVIYDLTPFNLTNRLEEYDKTIVNNKN